MAEAPERIWAHPADEDRGGRWLVNEPVNRVDFTLYIRADLVPQWQPIETAPKDGSNILLYRKGRKPMVGAWWTSPGGFAGYWLCWGSGAPPTHWAQIMELPA